MQNIYKIENSLQRVEDLKAIEREIGCYKVCLLISLHGEIKCENDENNYKVINIEY